MVTLYSLKLSSMLAGVHVLIIRILNFAQGYSSVDGIFSIFNSAACNGVTNSRPAAATLATCICNL